MQSEGMDKFISYLHFTYSFALPINVNRMAVQVNLFLIRRWFINKEYLCDVMLSLQSTRILLLVACGMSIASLSAQTPPPMQTGNGSDLELANPTWPRDNQLPTTISDTHFMQKKLTDRLEEASLQVMRPSTMFPENPSEFMLNVILLHTVKNSIAGLQDETIARMVSNLFPSDFLKSLSHTQPTPVVPWTMGIPGSTASSGIVFTGLFDPVEIYRNWKRHKQNMRTQLVLATLFGDDERLLSKNETDSIARALDEKRNAPTGAVAHPTPTSTLLQNDTIVAPSKPKFTAPLFGKERPQQPR